MVDVLKRRQSKRRRSWRGLVLWTHVLAYIAANRWKNGQSLEYSYYLYNKAAREMKSRLISESTTRCLIATSCVHPSLNADRSPATICNFTIVIREQRTPVADLDRENRSKNGIDRYLETISIPKWPDRWSGLRRPGWRCTPRSS